MAIIPTPAPANIALNALAELRIAPRSSAALEMSASPMDVGGASIEVGAAQPLPIYTIPIQELAARKPSSFADASQQGWRVLTVDGSGSNLVDVAADTGRAIAVRRGASAAILTRAGMLAEDSVEEGSTYQARVIDFGQLGMSALWLHSEETEDRFFSLEIEPKEAKADELLKEAERRARRYVARSEDQGGGRALPDDIGG